MEGGGLASICLDSPGAVVCWEDRDSVSDGGECTTVGEKPEERSDRGSGAGMCTSPGLRQDGVIVVVAVRRRKRGRRLVVVAPPRWYSSPAQGEDEPCSRCRANPPVCARV